MGSSDLCEREATLARELHNTGGGRASLCRCPQPTPHLSLWPTAKVSTGSYCYSSGDHSKPVLNLEGAAKLWPTPNLPTGGRTLPDGSTEPGITPDGTKRQVDLQHAAKGWATPNAHDGRRPGADTRSTQGANLSRDAAMWPTPDASVAQDGETPTTWLERRERVKATAENGNGMGTPLAMAARLWATPTARDWKSDDPDQSLEHSPLLGRQVLRTEAVGEPGSSAAVLNPSFVEALMGFPIGWTDCAPLETPSSRKSPRSRGKFSRSG